jgi:H+-transporting ATPase
LEVTGYEGEEYDVLLRYVEDEKAKLSKRGNEQEEDEKDVKYTRKWYTPWKKTKISTAAKKVSLYVSNA